MMLVLPFMLLGFVVIGISLAVTYSSLRDDVTVGEAWMAGSKLTAHPERYVLPERVFAVRTLSYLGVGLWLAGVVAMVAMTILHP